MFTLTILNVHEQFARSELMLGSSKIAVVNSHDGTSIHNLNQASNAVLIECEAGEHAWVQSDCAADFGLLSGIAVIFSGFRIQ